MNENECLVPGLHLHSTIAAPIRPWHSGALHMQTRMRTSSIFTTGMHMHENKLAPACMSGTWHTMGP